MQDNQNSNPYAPPLSDELGLQKAVPPIDKHFIELLNLLEANPISVSGFIPRSTIDIASTQVKQDMKPMPGARTALVTLISLIALAALLRVGSVRGLFLFIFCAAVVALFSIRYNKRLGKMTALQNPVQVQIPEGIYRWLITDGGIVVTTPSGGQWCYPWSQIRNLSFHRDTWVLKPSRLMTPHWPIPGEAFSDIQSELVRQLSNIVSDLAVARRPSPVKHMLRSEWGDGLTMYHGEDWSVLREREQVWCEVQGTTISLPKSEVRVGTARITVVDPETSWYVQLNLLGGDTGRRA